MLSGFGLGLRHVHYEDILHDVQRPSPPDTAPAPEWFEVLIDNYLGHQGRLEKHARHHQRLAALRQHRNCSFHSVSLNLGGHDPIDKALLTQLKRLVDEYQPEVYSDHLAWTQWQGTCHHDLLPVELTQDSLARVTSRIHQVQEALGREIAIENPTLYLCPQASYIPEPEFFQELTKNTGCQLILDLNNIYVNGLNHAGWAKLETSARLATAQRWIASYPLEQVAYLHVAGFSEDKTTHTTHYIDSHGSSVHKDVLSLLSTLNAHVGSRTAPEADKKTGRKTGRKTVLPVCLERDQDIPCYSDLKNELNDIKLRLELTNDHRQHSQCAQRSDFAHGARSKAAQPTPRRSATAWKEQLSADIYSASRAKPNKDTTVTVEPPMQPSFEGFAVPRHARIKHEQGLEIYRRNLFLGVSGALEADFPLLSRLFGPGPWLKLAKDYIRSFPSRHPDLNRVSCHFVTFMQHLETSTQQPRAQLSFATLAAFEQLWDEVRRTDAHDNFSDSLASSSVEAIHSPVYSLETNSTLRFFHAPSGWLQLVQALHATTNTTEARQVWEQAISTHHQSSRDEQQDKDRCHREPSSLEIIAVWQDDQRTLRAEQVEQVWREFFALPEVDKNVGQTANHEMTRATVEHPSANITVHELAQHPAIESQSDLNYTLHRMLSSGWAKPMMSDDSAAMSHQASESSTNL